MAHLLMNILILVLARVVTVEGQMPQLCRAASHFCFTYNPELINGPHGWSYLKGCSCCSGLRQSPIDIPLAIVQQSCGHFMQVGYQNDVTLSGPLLNNGLYPKFNPRLSDSPPTLLGVPQNTSLPYIFANLHLHVGGRGRPGSEHSINGVSFEGEVHLVHYASGLTGLPEASTVPSGITVIAIFLSTQYGEVNSELNALLSKAPMIQRYQGPGCTPHFRATPNDFEPFSFGGSGSCNYHDDDSYCGKPVSCTIRPARMLPTSGLFYTYQGSLTTPPCSEAVNWIVMRDPLFVSPQQLRYLQRMQVINDEFATLSTFSNARQRQPLNGRMVHANFCPTY